MKTKDKKAIERSRIVEEIYRKHREWKVSGPCPRCGEEKEEPLIVPQTFKAMTVVGGRAHCADCWIYLADHTLTLIADDWYRKEKKDGSDWISQLKEKQKKKERMAS